MSTLVTPRGSPLVQVEKAKSEEGRARIAGLSPWLNSVVGNLNVNGAQSKEAAWRDYYDMYRQHPIIRAAIEKIAKTATTVGFDFVPRTSTDKPKTREINQLRKWFDGQGDFSTQLAMIYKDLLIYGDAFLYVVPDRRRRPSKLKRIPPKTIQIKVKRNGQVEAYYQYDTTRPQEDPIAFQPHEFLHFKFSDPDNDVYGLSLLESLKFAVATDLWAQRYNASFFRNSGVTGTVISINNANPDEVERNRKWLLENYTGPESAHKPLVLEGDITVAKSSNTHTEMGFEQLRRMTVVEILAVLDVPPAKLGFMESANRSNSKEQDKSFRVESIDPLQNLVESVINKQFVQDILGIENTIFVHSESDSRDALEAAELHQRYINIGVENINEVRSSLGKAAVDGGDTNFIMTPTGAVPVDRMNLYFSLPQVNTDKIPVDPDDPSEGEDMPARTANVTTVGQGRSTNATKSLKTVEQSIPPAVSLSGAIQWIEKAMDDQNALFTSYSYLKDAHEELGNDFRVTNAFESLKRACSEQDPFARRGYITRASGFLAEIIKPKEAIEPEPERTVADDIDELLYMERHGLLDVGDPDYA